MDKHQVADKLREMAQMLELKDENPYKVIAYRKAADSLELSEESLSCLIEENKLADLPGIGEALKEKIEILYRTGTHPALEKLKKEIVPGLIELMELQGLGAKKVRLLHEGLGINSKEELKAACEKGQVSKLAHFGEKMEHNLLEALSHHAKWKERRLYGEIQPVARAIQERLMSVPGVSHVDIVGSIRRFAETPADIDILASGPSRELIEAFTSMESVETTLAKGKFKASIKHRLGIQVDLRVTGDDTYPFNLIYFTGSKEHNIQLRNRAKKMGMKLSEWGLTQDDDELIAENEEEVYKLLGLSYITPELREGLGEIESAESNHLPQLIRETDIRGVFHVHTTASDGKNTLEQMAEFAAQLGWEYLGISDHSKSSVQAGGLSEERLFEQMEAIDRYNESKNKKIHLFKGVECDIMKDGSLDYERAVLEKLDFTIVSIHRFFTLSKEEQTKRLIKAIENPYTTMVGHLTGRLLLRRDAYPLNVKKVIDAAADNGKIIELNASPDRLDMDWRHWHYAKEKGVLASINPDAHSKEGLLHYAQGVSMARKGWLQAEDVLNTHPLAKVKKLLKSIQSGP
ncbi:DNA polymerase/3'-5' exonuclease PolX [Estrella lausannensis]|uniref:DNA polymerase beta n=1 Tax=Estrella lausannensis TaxID=483423 RepID=A0A0H5E4Q0_9BACT|nr:DNA polymerase/3'-5' exonuclease PolX [Estrella lausannensis]CRX38215.1 PHP domain protein [Estrella lausannensis]